MPTFEVEQRRTWAASALPHIGANLDFFFFRRRRRSFFFAIAGESLGESVVECDVFLPERCAQNRPPEPNCASAIIHTFVEIACVIYLSLIECRGIAPQVDIECDSENPRCVDSDMSECRNSHSEWFQVHTIPVLCRCSANSWRNHPDCRNLEMSN